MHIMDGTAHHFRSSFKDILKSPHPPKSLSRQVTRLSEPVVTREDSTVTMAPTDASPTTTIEQSPNILQDVLQFNKDQPLYRQVKNTFFLRQLNIKVQSLIIVHVFLVLRYYSTLIPLVEVLQQCIRTKKRPVFSATFLYKEGKRTRAHTQYRLLKLRDARDTLQHEINSLQNFALANKSEKLFDLYTKIGE